MSPAKTPILKRTPAQSLAAEPAVNVWVSANAGTGKTRVLVDRIARLLLNGARPEKILCLTFTKTGAAEMADRIRSVLGAWAIKEDDDLFADLHALIGGEPSPETLTTARTLFARVLDVPGGLKIRTIHSFCESLIGRFPIESHVAPHFSVIDERTTAELLTHARERILEHTLAVPNSPLTHAMNVLAELVHEDEFTSLMQGLVKNRTHVNAILNAGSNQDDLQKNIETWVGLSPQDGDIKTIIKNNVTDQALDAEVLKSAADVLMLGAKTSQKIATSLTSFLNMPLAQRAQTFQSHYVGLYVTNTGAPRKRLITKGAEAATEALCAAQTHVINTLERIRARTTADATAALLCVGQDIIKTYEHLKQRRAYLDYDDLIETARTLLSTHGGISWVHFKLDGGIDHILVDESQDTSPAQWDVVQSLATDFHAGQGRHEDQADTPRTIFAVGDEKQSIYSFQGADPFEFGRMRDYFKDRVTGAGQSFRTVELIQSFRTVSAVLNIVDDVFAQPNAADGLTFDNNKIIHHTSRQGDAGRVELWPSIKYAPAPKDDPWDAPLDYQNSKSAELRLAEKIADTIHGWIDGKDHPTTENRPIRPGDILILVRRRARFAEAMVNQLKKRGIAVAGADRMTLTDQIAVMDLLSVGRFAILPEDSLSLAEVLKCPLVGLTEDALFDLAYDRQGNLWAELTRRHNERPDFLKAFEFLKPLLIQADFAPPYEFFAGLLQGGGRKALIDRLGADAEDPLDEFLSLALDFERTHTPSLQGFLQWVTVGGTEIKRDMETSGDKVRVMTVHGAKGLEAPIVFLTDTCKTPDGRHNARVQWNKDQTEILWAPYKQAQCKAFTDRVDAGKQDQIREYRRLLYVAMTRAKDRLYVTGFEDKNGRADGCWYDLIAAAMGQCATPLTDDEEPILRYETPQTAPAKTPKTQGQDNLVPPLPTWAHQSAPVESKPSRPLSPSQPDAEAPAAYGPFDGDHTDRFKRGLLIHKLLESLPELVPEKRHDAAQNWLAQPGHDLSPDQQAEILTETLGVLNNPDFADLFGPNSLAEVAVSGVLGETVVSARLDRLSVGSHDVTVIDYKTNRPAPTNIEKVPMSYLHQMATYHDLLAQIYPQKQIRCVLLWTDGPHAMVLDEDIFNKIRPA